MHAALVAAVGDVQLHAKRHASIQRALPHLLHQAHWAAPCAGCGGLIGSSETSRMPWLARSVTKLSASFMASLGSTSNSAHTLRSTISSSVVVPSADCQMMVPIGFRVNSVESRADMIIISPSRDDGAYWVQGEQRGVPGRHDHHLAVQHAGGDLGCASYIKRTHAISSQTRASGTKVRRYTGTRFTSSHADSKTWLTSSESWAKNRT